MTYKRLKTVVMQIESHMDENPNVDDEAMTRLALLRDRLIGFLDVDEQSSNPVNEADAWTEITEIIEREIAEFEVQHPELARKLDDIITGVANAGI